MSRLLILVGECPPKPMPPEEFGSGRFGATLCKHSGVPIEAYYRHAIRLDRKSTRLNSSH